MWFRLMLLLFAFCLAATILTATAQDVQVSPQQGETADVQQIWNKAAREWEQQMSTKGVDVKLFTREGQLMVFRVKDKTAKQQTALFMVVEASPDGGIVISQSGTCRIR